MTNVRCRLLDDRRGVVSVEFGLLAAPLIMLIFGAIDVGLLSWTEGVVQAAATVTARCAAIGSASCPNIPQYGATLAQQGLFTGAVLTSEVSVATAASCNGVAGSYVVVTINAHHWAGTVMIPALVRPVISAQACYPAAT